MSILSRLHATWGQDIRLRTTVILSFLLGAILLTATVWRLEEIRTSLEESSRSRAHAIGRTFTVLGSAALNDNLYRIQKALISFRDDGEVSRADVLDTNRVIIASTEPERIGRILTDHQTMQALEASNELIAYDETARGPSLLVVVEPLREGDLITGWVRIEFSLAEIQNEIARSARGSILIAVLLIGISILIARFSMRRISVLLRDTTSRLQVTLTSLHQQFPSLGSPSDQSHTSSALTISPQSGEIERTVELINHSIRLLTRQTESIRTFASWLEEAVASRTSQLNDTVEDLKRETAERALTEQALRENETKYRGLFESSRDAIMLLSPPDWKFTACNPATVALFGADSIEHFTTLGPWDVSPLLQPDGEPSNKKAASMIQRAMENGSHSFDWTHRRINGAEFAATVLLTRTTLNGQTGLQATVRDVSEQRRAEQRLLDLSAFQKAILDNAGHAIISATADGIIRVFNPAAEALLGYSAEEMIGKQTPAVFHDPEEVAARAHSFSAELGVPITPGFDVFVEKCRRGLPNEHEWTYIRKDGRRLTVLLSITALSTPEGSISAFLGVASDITSLKIVQRELTLAKEAAESASKAKSQFLANMSHEIRTPMNGVLGMTELLGTTQLNERQRHMVDTIHRSGRALLGIINDILDFSKIEAGKLALEHIEFDLHQVVTETIELFTGTARKKGLTVTCVIPAETPTVAIGDPVRLRQVLLNLIGNAVKFTERGEISVHVNCLMLDTEWIQLKCAVTDTGVGITEEAQQRIFTAFSQADGSTTRRFGGTGLGLTIVKQLVQLLGGEIGVESLPGHGSTFWFTAKLGSALGQSSIRPVPHTNTLSSPNSASPVVGTRVLLAEDNPVNREVALGMLESMGCHVEMVEDGGQAVEAAAKQQYDLIFMDCQMPNMDGFTATAMIRAHEASHKSTRHMPIIALTANALEGDREKCLAAGMDDYLSKPFSLEGLRTTLQRWTGEKGVRSQPSTSETPDKRAA